MARGAMRGLLLAAADSADGEGAQSHSSPAHAVARGTVESSSSQLSMALKEGLQSHAAEHVPWRGHSGKGADVDAAVSDADKQQSSTWYVAGRNAGAPTCCCRWR